eukprot:TRINITY_DN1997_c1_g1_i3.p1 TRINITY_DN1997_c1_g1~~TRINITY_DN1997_c1_g1_i3.p1  ORF type:complete len:1515 (+),score=209.13 TRINITY_DN1997_c1_g1_i3:294-4547(+)
MEVGQSATIHVSIINPDSCRGIEMFPVRDVSGLHVTLKAGEFMHSFMEDGFSPLPYGICCQDLRDKAGPLWDGQMELELKTDVATHVQFWVAATKIRPISDGYGLVPFSITCHNSHPCGDAVGCYSWNVDATTEDPFFHWRYLKLKSQLDNKFSYPPLPSIHSDTNSITSVLLISAIADDELYPNYNMGIGESVLGEKIGELHPSCRIQYSGLYDSEGNDLAPAPIDIKPQEVSCDASLFKYYYDGFSETLATLNSRSLQTFTESTSLVNFGYLYATSLQWRACKAGLEHHVQITETDVILQTTDCLRPIDDVIGRSQDPCCNNDPTMCCVAANYTAINTTYKYLYEELSDSEVAETTDAQMCSFPYCVKNTVTAYVNYSNEESFCSEELQKDLSDVSLTSDPWDLCVGLVLPYHKKTCINDATCVTMYGEGSYCLDSVCSAACISDSDCSIGTCVNNNCVYNSSATKDFILRRFARCLLIHIDSDLAGMISDKLFSQQVGSGELELAQVPTFLINEIGEDACNFNDPLFGLSFAGPTNQEECEAAMYCPMLNCVIGSTDWCTLENCELNMDVCVKRWPDNGLGMFHIFNAESHCTYRIRETMAPTTLYKDICNSFGGLISNRYLYANRDDEGICNTGVKTEDKNECYPSECIPELIEGVDCASYCYSATAVDQSACDALGAGYSWVDGRKCILEGVSYNSCIDNNLEYFLGIDFLPSLMTPEQCEGGFCSFVRSVASYREHPYHYTESECAANTCTSCTPTSTDEECFAFHIPTPPQPDSYYKDICSTKGTCYTGGSVQCLISDDAILSQYDYCPWAPGGCIFGFPETQCNDLGGQFLRISDKTICESWGGICRETSSASTGGIITPNKNTVPNGFTMKDETQCNMCGFEYESFFKWDQSNWVRARVWGNGKYGKPVMQYPVWEPFVSQTKWASVLNSAKAAVAAGHVTTQLNCQFGVEREFVLEYACNCGSDNSSIRDVCTETLNSIYGTIVTSANVCTGKDRNITDSRNVSLVVSKGFTAGETKSCAAISLTSTDFELLSINAATISSLSVVTHTERTLTNKRKYVYAPSDRMVVVGHVVDRGYGVTVVESNITGLQMCLNMPSLDEVLDLWTIPNAEPVWIALGVYDETLGYSLITEYKAKLSNQLTQLCIPITESTLVFPVGLVEGWEELSIQDTWSSPEWGLFIFCDVLYFWLFVFSAVSLWSRYYRWKKNPESILWNTAAIGLAILTVLSLLRFIYFITAPFGYYDTYFGLVTVFSDLPTLLYYFILVYLSFTWFDIYRQSKTLNPSPRYKTLLHSSMIIGSLSAFWIAFYIAFGTIQEELPQVSCVYPQTEDLTLSSKLSLTYKVIFSFYSVCLAVMFFINSLLFMSLGLSKRRKRLSFWKLFLLSRPSHYWLKLSLLLLLYLKICPTF